jgi:hypothetical protein
MGGFAFRGIDRQLAFSHKRRAQGPRDAMKSVHEAYFGATRPRNARLRPRGQVIPEVVIEAPGVSPARKPRINLRPTGDGEACEDPRSRRMWRCSGANVISQAEKFAKLDFNCG